MASAVELTYIEGLWAMPPVGYRGKAPGLSALDLTIRPFGAFRYFIHHCLLITVPLMQKNNNWAVIKANL